MSALSKFFPMIRAREEILREINTNASLKILFDSWNGERQKEFLDMCSGMRGHRILYDVYFKYIFDPQTDPENFRQLISSILGIQISSMEVVSSSSALVDETHSFMVMDIVVKLQDGTTINVEVQKIGYEFPGQRAACYSSDLLLRQYSQMKREKKDMSYKDLKKVFTIVLAEKSSREFQTYRKFLHHFRQQSDTGLEIELLQEYYFVPLDIFTKTMQDKPIEKRSELEAWLTFLTVERPEQIEQLIRAYPKFEPIYRRLYELCFNIEGAMRMFSEQLKYLDRNTAQLMIDELREEVAEWKDKAKERDDQLKEQSNQLKERDDQIKELKKLTAHNAERERWLAGLISKLVADGRTNDIERAVNDEAYCEKLLKEYHII